VAQAVTLYASGTNYRLFPPSSPICGDLLPSLVFDRRIVTVTVQVLAAYLAQYQTD
jgi:hypothetical protein